MTLHQDLHVGPMMTATPQVYCTRVKQEARTQDGFCEFCGNTNHQKLPEPNGPIVLEVHICDQRRSYRVEFANEDQALAFIAQRSNTHAFYEIEDEPLDYATRPRLAELLYPTCEHGLSQSNCFGPQHYYFDEEEQARGMRNS